ncbi:hypothetical protein HYU17_02280 [Candidatus Woesearchaeota archaeon]|nr:hypothetical protein [Candidatus Woesearchaeota archaeon]
MIMLYCECGEAVGCADNDYALAHPEECGQPVGCSDNDYALAHPVECGEAVGCADNDYALLHPVECGQPVGCTEKFIDNYRCSPNGFDRQREKLFADCTKQWVTIETCTFGCQKVFADPSVPVSCFSPPADVPPQQPVVDNLPHVSIDVPASAAPGAQLGIAVTGTDDIDVRELNLFNSNNVKIASFDCVGIQATCSATFLVNAPATPNTAYTFRARSKDSVNQESGFVSDSGVTTAALAVPLPAVSRAAAVPQVQRVVPRPLQDITVRFPLQPLFMRSLSFPDSDCVKPGESALLAVKVQNTGRAILKDVVFSAFVPELDLRSRIGPLKMASDDKLPRFLGIDVPENAPEGTYLLRFTVNNNRFTRAVHRSFVISGSC